MMAKSLRVYIARHGEALPHQIDASRALSARGVMEVERVAMWASRKGIKIEQIRHSGIVRAKESAEIYAQHLQPESGTRSVSGLKPNDAAHVLAKELVHETDTLLLVGHLPFMGLLAEALIKGDNQLRSVHFPTGGFAGFEYNGTLWSLICTATPDEVAPKID
jgi:phosphohistidine phosphatase